MKQQQQQQQQLNPEKGEFNNLQPFPLLPSNIKLQV